MDDSRTNSRCCRYLGKFVLVACAIVAAFVPVGQSQQSSVSAFVHGTIRNSAGTPLEGVLLRIFFGTTEISMVQTGANGMYRSLQLSPGEYTIRVGKAGFQEITFGPFVLDQAQVRTIDLRLDPVVTAEKTGSPAAKPEFYDEPQFTVAGITDTMNHGGHGSDVTSHTSQSLTKDMSALHGASEPGASTLATAATQRSLRKTLERDPDDFAANYQLGTSLAADGKLGEALPFLERAHRMRKEDYGSAYAVADAYARTGKEQEARKSVKELLAREDKAELHHLLAELDEKLKDPLAAVREYQRAAELAPTEANLFDWGTDLLTHRTFQPAIEVFMRGHQQFPQSSRMLLGLGVASYAAGSQDLAERFVGEASDLDPFDPGPYLVLGKITTGETSASSSVLDRFARFARLHSDSAQANYYYAVALWKQGRISQSPETVSQVESLLEKACELEPKLAVAFLQLGILYEKRGNLPKALTAYQTAESADPQLKEAHYRLAQTYRRTGDKGKAEQELAAYARISREAAAQNEREAQEIPQFVYTLRDSKAPALPQ